MKEIKIHYYFDALCGWCFGFSETMQRIYAKYKGQIEFEVYSGGLFLGQRTGYINDVAPYIKQGAYLQVEQTTGSKFGAQFLENAIQKNSMYMHSIYPAIALAIVKTHSPELQMEYAAALLSAFYKDGLSADDIPAYEKYALQTGISISDFSGKMAEEKYNKLALAEYDFTHQQGVNGYPAVKMTAPNGTMPLSNGFTSFEELDERVAYGLENFE